MKLKFLPFLIVITLLNQVTGWAQDKPRLPYQNTNLPIDERVDNLLAQMTMQEKVTQLFNHSPAIKRLGIREYDWWNESLHGVSGEGKATVFPQAIGLAATFDQNLMFRVADATSDEARAKNNYFVANNVFSTHTGLTFWAPNINIYRDPRWGRGQETYGEDPFLSGKLAVNYIKGLQGNNPKYLKLVATAKHYAVHSGPEHLRHTDNVFINNNDLFNTYLPAFKMAVKEANVQSVMCAYTRFRDKPCCGSDLLLTDILRNQFGFKGYVVSDCAAITDFFAKKGHGVVSNSSRAWGWALSSGTDLNCEESRAFLIPNLDSVINTGVINESDINISLKRLLKARFMLGMFDPPEMVPFSKIPYSVIGSEKHMKLTLEAAEKSLVLLKNNGILPLRNMKKIALIGPNANNFTTLIGNYNGIPIRPVTALKGLHDKVGGENLIYALGSPIVDNIYSDLQVISVENLFHQQGGKLLKGLKAEYFTNTKFQGNPKLVRVDPKIDFYWMKSPISNLVEEEFSVRWTGVLKPQLSGKYQFGGNVKLRIDDKVIAESAIALEKGKTYKIVAELVVEYTPWFNVVEPSATLSWIETNRDYRKEALDAAAKADVVVFCGGISADLEGEEKKLSIEGFSHGDRTSISLPKVQEDLLKDLHKTGKPVIYVNFSGGAMALNWEEENLPAVVQAFYPGEATGTALARLLFGEFNPSGRLPLTFYKSEKDLPAFTNYDMEGRTYRYFKGIPLYPFGYGLSYTTFQYSNLQVDEASITNTQLKVTLTVKNTGSVDGEEVVQLYLANKTATVNVPQTSLKGFERVALKKGEQKSVTFTLLPEDFSIINQESKQVVEPGTFEITAGGSSSGNELLRKVIQRTGDVVDIK